MKAYWQTTLNDKGEAESQISGTKPSILFFTEGGTGQRAVNGTKKREYCKITELRNMWYGYFTEFNHILQQH